MKSCICRPDFGDAISKIGAALGEEAGNLCLAARADGCAGCTATYLVPDGSGNLVREADIMPKCNVLQSTKPCFALAADATRYPDNGCAV
ncbi:MAG: hypothetical protein JXP73_11590 [Deltaproteobacteria bacterium]|nr:hypothetical protein [Deltaproteobacteria bacterium]